MSIHLGQDGRTERGQDGKEARRINLRRSERRLSRFRYTFGTQPKSSERREELYRNQVSNSDSPSAWFRYDLISIRFATQSKPLRSESTQPALRAAQLA
ncbi:hypothetical protein H8E77_10225 [bacterium]|nr:hypothetical protein [bacterium]